MRDGTVLYADVYRPAADARYPVLLQRTPYNKDLQTLAGMLGDPMRFCGAGYVVVIQDTRGRYASEGSFYPFRAEVTDGYDTVEWCAAQPWSNGRVGMFGASYVGATQWLAALARPPHLKAIAPVFTASDYFDGWTYQGGAFELGFALSWVLSSLIVDTARRRLAGVQLSSPQMRQLVEAIDHMPDLFGRLPIANQPELSDDASYYFDWLDHPTDDPYWLQWSIEDRYGDITVPALNVGGWYDIFLGGTIRNFEGMQSYGATPASRRGQNLTIGPWLHSPALANPVGEIDFGLLSTAAAIDLDGLQLRWFDYWLKGVDTGIADDPGVRIFVMGTNVWRDEQEWPLARTQYQEYFLHSDGRANSLRGSGRLSRDVPSDEPPDTFLYNPLDPVPTSGGGLCCSPVFTAAGAFDQRCIESRHDVLVYSTPPLEQDLEVTGPVSVTLYASSSADDTDWTAKLVDISPGGYARNLADGIIRARYRESLTTPALLRPGDIYQYTIDLWATSNVFKAGNRIRLEISSSNFPRFARNLNTGGSLRDDGSSVTAMQRVYHDGGHPSCITLPVIASDAT